MENRKETLSVVKMCRFCLTQNKSLISLYERNKSSRNTVSLPLKILSCVSIEIFPSDKKPTYICERCKFFMNAFYEFKNIVRQADESILQYIQNGSAMGTVTWPPVLNKIFRSINSTDIVKTVVEGGATVQVTSHDLSESDDDDGNIYNVKIDDDENTKTCIKVVTSNEKVKEESSNKDSGSDENKMPEKEIEEGCWACNECDCTYPLEQLLDLHKVQKHRVRTVDCDQCDAKFYTKYDLATHQLRHSCNMPFECVACGKKFKRLILLKRHEKMMHPEIPQLLCPNCPATFLAVEDLQAHQKKHIRIQKPYTCPFCDKNFQERSTLQRHKEVVHNKASMFCCEYCPERFGSISKLAKHVRTHAGERPYPCKYCDKSFTKSHHYTRHLRIKHRESIRSVRLAGPSEQYRCEQCDDVFDSQDDLIYHSAIHATQNLTCPLCQEKFEDVEAVTAHIKSHVNGVEFMCDFCELIFTTQEKLQDHIMTVHEDELQNQDELLDESSMEIDGEDEDDDNGINVKEDGDDMIIEIKKPDNYLVNNSKDDTNDKMDNTNSEESENENTYTELQTVDTLALLEKNTSAKSLPEKLPEKSSASTVTTDHTKSVKSVDNQSAAIVRKADEVKSTVPETLEPVLPVITRKIKSTTKSESSNSGGTSDKSLRLLEKELQDLKRTNSRSTETTKTSSVKVLETLKNKKPQFQTSTPKLRNAEEKKLLANKTPVVDKKQIEKRIITKENKEPKDTKDVKNNNGSSEEEKESKEKDKKKEKEKDKDIKEKEKDKDTEKDKGKETPKTVIKNGSAIERSTPEEGCVRRSTRPSKIKDYAKMIRERTQVVSEDEDDDTTEDDEDYQEPDKTTEVRRGRRLSQPVKPAVTNKTPAMQTPANPPRKRGRPRKEIKDVPAKVKKEDNEVEEANKDKNDTQESDKITDKEDKVDTKADTATTENEQVINKTPEPTNISTDVLVSPTGQTLKKVPMKALPPGVKPLPLPANARPLPGAELCQMQIGKKVVKVQKIVMTKAEVEAMAKKGLVEMKGGTMVLKQGIRLKPGDMSTVKSTLIGDGESLKEPNKREKAAPTRCDLGDES